MATIKSRIEQIESKLNPQRGLDIIICHQYDEAEKLEAFKLSHGGRLPDTILLFQTVIPDGRGGVIYLDEASPCEM